MMRAFLAGAIALVAVAWFALSGTETAPPTVDHAPHFAGYTWPAGTGLRYRMDFSTHSETARFEPLNGQAPPSLTGAFHLVGDLVLRSYGPATTGTRLGLTLENLSTAEINLLGSDVLPDAEAVARQLLAHEALVDMDAHGRVLAVHFADDSGLLFRNVTQLLLSELTVELPGRQIGGQIGSQIGSLPASQTGESREKEQWSAEATTQHGVAATDYTRAGDTVQRKRAHYLSLQAETQDWTPTVDGVATATVEPNGPLLTLTGHEHLRAVDAGGTERLKANTRFEFRLIERFDSSDDQAPAIGVSYAPGAPAIGADEAEQHAKQRIDGLTADALLNTLATHGRFGKVPDHNRFLWRATALLQENPALCEQLADLFGESALEVKGRLLVLDLLVAAGTPEAQTALRRAITSDAALNSPKYVAMYQRLGLFEQPTPETIALASERYREPQAEGLGGAAYTLGAVARHAPDPSVTREIGERLIRDLNATDPEAGQTQRTLLFALGNAAYGAETVRSFADNAHPELRRAAAAALRHHRDPESLGQLVELAGDSEVQVARRALRSLSDGPLTDTQLAALRDLVASGRMDEDAYHGLASMLTPYLDNPIAVDTLRGILAQKLKDPRVKSRIRALLGGA